MVSLFDGVSVPFLTTPDQGLNFKYLNLVMATFSSEGMDLAGQGLQFSIDGSSMRFFLPFKRPMRSSSYSIFYCEEANSSNLLQLSKFESALVLGQSRSVLMNTSEVKFKFIILEQKMTKSVLSEGKAIPFILKNPQTDTYELCSEAETLLKSINTPISIVTVAGLYRTGKSYLLNRVILNSSNGFNVGPTINPCTKGLWIWNQVISTHDNKSVLVVDTEGLGALDQEANHDMKIFSLAVLLSTTFIYNSVGSIDQNALQTLSLVLNLVESIDHDQQSSRPSFIWVVRDFSLQLIDEHGKTISPKQYLQKALNSEVVNKDSQKMSIRSTITKAFSERNCFTLYKPIIDENKLQKLDQIPMEDLRPEFVSQTMQLRKTIFSSLKQLKLSNSQGIQGSDFIIMVQKYLSAINQGKVPNLTDTWTFIKEEKSRQVVDHLTEAYTEKVKAKVLTKLPIKNEALEEVLDDLHNDIHRQYHKLAYESSEPQGLDDFVKRLKSSLRKANQEQLKIYVKNLYTKQFEPFHKKLYSDFYTSIEEFISDVQKKFKQPLIEQCEGKVPNIESSISLFLQKKMAEAFKYLNKKLANNLKVAEQARIHIEQSLKNEIEIEKNRWKAYSEELKVQITVLDRKVVQLEMATEDNQRASVQEMAQIQGREKDLKQTVQNLQERIQGYQEEITRVNLEKSHFEKEVFVLKKEFQKKTALLEQSNQLSQNQVSQIQIKYKESQSELQKKILSFEAEKKELIEKLENSMKSLVQENHQKSDLILELETSNLRMRGEIQAINQSLIEKEQSLIEQKDIEKKTLISDFSSKKESQSQKIIELEQTLAEVEKTEQLGKVKICELQEKLKQVTEELNHSRHNEDKSIAIHLQKIQFQEAEIRDLKVSIEEMKRNHQNTVQSLQTNTKGSEEKYFMKIRDVTEAYESKIQETEKVLNERYWETKKELQLTQSSKQDLEIALSVERKKYENKEKELKDSYAKLETMYKSLSEKFTNSEKDFHDLSQEKESFFTMRIKQLEQEIDENKDNYSKEIQENQKASSEALAVLKNYTEMEREQWEKRLSDEKEKSNNKIKAQKEEYEKRLFEEKQILEEENGQLTQKIDEMERVFNEAMQNMKYDHDIEVQKLTNQFMEEKVELSKKNALLTQEIQLTKINFENQLQDQQRRSEQEVQSIRKEFETEMNSVQTRFEEERSVIESKYESLKKSSREMEQQNLKLSYEMDKYRSLLKEKESAHLKKVNELEQRLSQQLFTYTKTLEEMKNSKDEEIKRLNSEIDNLKANRVRLEDEKAKILQEKQAVEANLMSKVTYLENKVKTKKAEYEDLMNKFTKTTEFLNKKVEALKKQKEELSSNVKYEFEQQLSLKEDTLKRENKEYNDRIYRLQTENKSLRDKITVQELKISSNESQKFQASECEKNFIEELEMRKADYIKKQEEYRRTIEKLKKENKRIKEEKEILELSNNFERSKSHQYPTQEHQNRHSNERDSIIHGLDEYQQQSVGGYHRATLPQKYTTFTASKSRVINGQQHLDNSKVGVNQSRLDNSRLSALGENKNGSNLLMTGQSRKTNVGVSPLTGNKGYTHSKNIRADECQKIMRYTRKD